MQVVRDPSGQISVTPGPGRAIFDRFVDHETGYLVVQETNSADPADNAVYVTLVDQRSGAPVDTAARAAQLDRDERVTVDPVTGLRYTARRTIDTRTGAESIIEKVFEVATDRQVASRTRVAFSAKREKTLLESYYERKNREASGRQFWSEEYPRMSLEERKGFWLAFFYRDMRVMGEAGQDQLGVFSPENYREWKQRDPEFDLILDYLAEQLPRAFAGEEQQIRQKIRAMRGQDA